MEVEAEAGCREAVTCDSLSMSKQADHPPGEGRAHRDATQCLHDPLPSCITTLASDKKER